MQKFCSTTLLVMTLFKPYIGQHCHKKGQDAKEASKMFFGVDLALQKTYNFYILNS